MFDVKCTVLNVTINVHGSAFNVQCSLFNVPFTMFGFLVMGNTFIHFLIFKGFWEGSNISPLYSVIVDKNVSQRKCKIKTFKTFVYTCKLLK